RRMRAVGRGLRCACGEAAFGEVAAPRGLPEFGFRVARRVLRRLVGYEQLQHHVARSFRTVGLGVDLHAGRGRTDATRGEHALAFDFNHAYAAIAVGPVARLRRVAEVR